jgi:2-keto-4-pentenoate hydratase/2-oxohepta-3-ene-1,7-dioic acid hydratase in catechol pathway
MPPHHHADFEEDPMRWSSYAGADGVVRTAVWHEDRLHPVPTGTSLVELLGDDGTRLREAAEAALRKPGVDPATVTLLPPVPRPPSIRDFMAFEEHVVTASAAIGVQVDPLWYSQPVFYFTNPACLRGPHDPVAISPGSRAFDYELEVAAVIGREGSDLTPDAAVEHIAGYVLFCDWSARDLQSEEMKLNLGPAKGKDSASSCGPWMLTPDELPPAAEMTASVNGKPYSAGRLDALYWTFGEMIAYASRGTRVVPGDLIGSGTVGTGCILELSRVHGADAYPYLVRGDRVRLEVDGLGAIDAPVVEGAPVHPLRKEST